MNAPASRRILQLAFVVSILVHVVAAAATHGLRQVHAAPPQPPTTLHIFRVATPPPTPPPTPTPRPRPAVPRPVAAHRIRVSHPVRLPYLRRSLRRVEGLVVVAGTPAPPAGPATVASGSPSAPPAAGTPSPTPSCAVPNVAATALNVALLDEPQAARDEGITGATSVEVRLSATGAIVALRIYRSSGNVLLDQAALRAARSSTYAPQLENCRPVAGSYLFDAEFE